MSIDTRLRLILYFAYHTVIHRTLREKKKRILNRALTMKYYKNNIWSVFYPLFLFINDEMLLYSIKIFSMMYSYI